MKVRGARLHGSRSCRVSVRLSEWIALLSYHYVCRSGGLRRDQLAAADGYVVIWFGKML